MTTEKKKVAENPVYDIMRNVKTCDANIMETEKNQKEEWVNLIIKLNSPPVECPEMTEVDMHMRIDMVEETLQMCANLDIKEVIIIPVNV